MYGPKDKEEAVAYRYGKRASFARGSAYDVTRCAAAVWRDFSETQCQRRPGHGTDGLFCKQHAGKPGGGAG